MTKTKDVSRKTEFEKKRYLQPKLKQYGDLRDLLKGQVAYSLQEGAYQEMNPPS